MEKEKLVLTKVTVAQLGFGFLLKNEPPNSNEF
jgi:hypothetical protein